MNAKPSISEDNGIAALQDKDINIYSVGISTGGAAEVRMAQANPKRHVIATTIDQEGLAFAARQIEQLGLGDRIEARLEDVAKPLPYKDNFFDFVYARLVLHYLPKHTLKKALAELRRVLRPGGSLYVVVRSTECDDAKASDATYDPETGLTTRVKTDTKTGRTRKTVRYFQTETSITTHLKEAGFSVQYVKVYEEQLYSDFMRTQLSPTVDHVIEVLVQK
jgi:ubiquinone/menaquinone biosynthesis C-methylase UbiE